MSRRLDYRASVRLCCATTGFTDQSFSWSLQILHAPSGILRPLHVSAQVFLTRCSISIWVTKWMVQQRLPCQNFKNTWCNSALDRIEAEICTDLEHVTTSRPESLQRQHVDLFKRSYTRAYAAVNHRSWMPRHRKAWLCIWSIAWWAGQYEKTAIPTKAVCVFEQLSRFSR